MKVIHISDKLNVDITDFVTSVTLSGDYRSASRTLDFGLANHIDPNIEKVTVELGNVIQLTLNDENIFYGIAWDRAKQSDSKEVSLMARDFGVYLLKNKASYNAISITPEDITLKLCKDFGIEVGSIAKTGVRISRKFLGDTLYDIIMTAYTLANDNRYMVLFDGKKLNVIEKATLNANELDASNLITSSISETLNEMVNRVNIYDANDNFIKTVENTEDVNQFGSMTDYLKATDLNYALKAKKMLRGVGRKIVVTNFGDISFISGRKVKYTDPLTNNSGTFYIDSDEHNWKNGIYTNKLTLNFENLMDEKEGGFET